MPNQLVNRTVLNEAVLDWADNCTPFVVRLYTNDHTPDLDDDTTAFTEAAYPGYPGTDNTIAVSPASDDGNEVILPTAGVNFGAPTSGGSDTIYGFYITWHPQRVGGVQVFTAAEFETPVILTVGGASLPLILNMNVLDYNNP